MPVHGRYRASLYILRFICAQTMHVQAVPDVGIGVEKAEMRLWERHYFIYAEEDSRQWQNILSKD